MQKELNPELFGSNISIQEQTKSLQSNRELPGQIEKRLMQFKNQIQSLHENTSKWITYFSEHLKATSGKMDKMQQQLSKLETAVQSGFTDLNQKHNHLNARLAERRTVESKVQELIDRHNNVLRSYEVRMSQLMRLLADKEAMVAQTQSALNEAKMEIARLKRL